MDCFLIPINESRAIRNSPKNNRFKRKNFV